MRSEILINKKGIVQSSAGDAPPEGGVCVIRTNQEYSITFDDKPFSIRVNFFNSSFETFIIWFNLNIFMFIIIIEHKD